VSLEILKEDVAVLKSKVDSMSHVNTDVAVLKNNVCEIDNDLREVKAMLTNSGIERHQQHEKLLTLINDNHSKAMSKIQSVCIYNDERITTLISPMNDKVNSIFNYAKATAYIFGAISCLAVILISVYGVWPQ